MRMKTLWATAKLFAVAMTFLSFGIGITLASNADSNSAASLRLRTKYLELRDQLGHNQFQMPISIESQETSDSVTGDIYALINYPFAAVDAALDEPSHLCEIMMLQLNTKYCRPVTDSYGSGIEVNVGKKSDQPLAETYRMGFSYRLAAETPDYLKVILTADDGPLGTHDYRLIIEAIPMDKGNTFIHFTYSYGYGLALRLGLKVYLSTIGRDKVGFTVIGKQPDGQPLYISGMRGVVERNTMRYYLAIEAFLGAQSAPPQARREKSLNDWFVAVERYPRQLHELEKKEYLDMKRKEYLRLITGEH